MAVETGELVFEDLAGMSDEMVIKKLTAIRGIGKWSAKMYLIFALNRQDIFPWYLAITRSLPIAGPAFIIGALFLINWKNRKAMHNSTKREKTDGSFQ